MGWGDLHDVFTRKKFPSNLRPGDRLRDGYTRPALLRGFRCHRQHRRSRNGSQLGQSWVGDGTGHRGDTVQKGTRYHGAQSHHGGRDETTSWMRQRAGGDQELDSLPEEQWDGRQPSESVMGETVSSECLRRQPSRQTHLALHYRITQIPWVAYECKLWVTSPCRCRDWCSRRARAVLKECCARGEQGPLAGSSTSRQRLCTERVCS
jgi:hypothetical protein